MYEFVMTTISRDFIQKLPKAELHVHIEGTLEPEQLLQFAERNKIAVPYQTPEQARQAYHFTNYQAFLDAYIQLTSVLQHEQDFYEMTLAYLARAAEQGVLHAEIFFDLQTYMPRGIVPGVIINGIHRALVDAQEKYGISGSMIMCFIRNLSEEDAFKALELCAPFKDKIAGIGLAALEEGNPPEKFARVFAQARAHGYHLVAHAGECMVPSAPEDIWQTIKLLDVERIDHGIGCVLDKNLMVELAAMRMPLTVCPLSNVALHLVKNMAEHPLKSMLAANIVVSIHSDDPVFFGGYIAENYYAAAVALDLSARDLISCARNSIISSFASIERKKECLTLLDAYINMYKK
jgi:adenine deaminase